MASLPPGAHFERVVELVGLGLGGECERVEHGVPDELLVELICSRARLGKRRGRKLVLRVEQCAPQHGELVGRCIELVRRFRVFQVRLLGLDPCVFELRKLVPLLQHGDEAFANSSLSFLELREDVLHRLRPFGELGKLLLERARGFGETRFDFRLGNPGTAEGLDDVGAHGVDCFLCIVERFFELAERGEVEIELAELGFRFGDVCLEISRFGRGQRGQSRSQL